MQTFILHHNDLDGRCAGAIAGKWARARDGKPVIFNEVDYNRPVPVDRVTAGSRVVITDFSLKPEIMKQIMAKGPSEVIWIDHHKTASGYDYGRELAGLRDFTDRGQSGCELAWRFFFPEIPLPLGIQLIGDLDAWRLDLTPDCLQFSEGIRLHSTAPDSPVWDRIFREDNQFLTESLARGETCCDYRAAYCADFCSQYGYKTAIAGIEAFACNISRFGSRAFGRAMENYPICIGYSHDGERFSVTLYTARPDLDVSAICREFGGGGHKQAAGFVCQELPFRRLTA